jgi:hypothetical protein
MNDGADNSGELEAGYREMVADIRRERDAEEWIDGLSKPLIHDAATWVEDLDRFNDEPFMCDGRHQPATLKRGILK